MKEALTTAQLGTTGMEITRVGFGSWAVGGGDWVSAWGAQDDGDSVAAIRHAVDSGINWIDTAAVYGLGHSEEVVARAIAPYPEADRPLVFTKGGLVWDPTNRRVPSRRVGEAGSLRAGVDGSLRRLGIDVIDLYFMHWPADDAPVEDYWATLVELRSEGKLRRIALSNHDRDALARAEVIGHVDAIQPQFSAINAAATDEVLPWCTEHGVGVVVYSPMGSGLLTGRFSAERVASLAEDDWRRRSPMFTTDLSANLRVADAMSKVAQRYGVTTSSVAVAWTLGFGGVSAAIVGGRSPQQVDDWVDAGSLVLSARDYAEIGATTPFASPAATASPGPGVP
jgi:aryl-alcohol dehydrogenase-like predicted oxidoreductase